MMFPLFSKTGSTISPDQPASCSEFVLVALGLKTGSSIFQESASDTGGSGDGGSGDGEVTPFWPPAIWTRALHIVARQSLPLPRNNMSTFQNYFTKGGTLLRAVLKRRLFP
jgi:hypothetical protein